MQLKLAHADANDLRVAARGRIADRIKTLLDQHAKAWTEELVKVASGVYEFRRGFVEGFTTRSNVKLPLALAQAPLLRSATFADAGLALAHTPAARRFVELRLIGPTIDEGFLRRVARALEGGDLRAIDFDLDRASVLGEVADWPIAVRHLGVTKPNTFRWERRRVPFFERFAYAPGRAQLQSLRLVNVDTSDAIPVLPLLEQLELRSCRIGDTQGTLARFLAGSPELTRLSLTSIRTAEIDAIVSACPKLRRVTLCDVGLSNASAIDAIVKLADLRRLDLSRNPLGQSALRRLLRAELPNLVMLTLPRALLDEKALKQLRVKFPGVEVHQV